MDVAQIGGVRIRVSLWLLPLGALAVWLGDGGTLLVMALCVTVHELAHAVTARALGLGVQELELMPFGGVARLTSTVVRGPGTEIAVALAGPVASLALAFLFSYLERQTALRGAWMGALIRNNAALAYFNLLPALPLDGGRVLRALLCRPLGFARATRVSAGLGMGAGAAVFALGVYGAMRGIWNLSILACGAFLCVAAWREGRESAYVLGRSLTLNRRALRRGAVPVRKLAAMGDTPLRLVLREMVPGQYHEVSVLDPALRTMGRLDEGGLLYALDRRPAATLREAIEQDGDV